MKTINIYNVLLFHKKIVEQTGGSTGIRDKNLIESALNRAFMTFDGIDLYKSIEEKISATKRKERTVEALLRRFSFAVCHLTNPMWQGKRPLATDLLHHSHNNPQHPDLTFHLTIRMLKNNIIIF